MLNTKIKSPLKWGIVVIVVLFVARQFIDMYIVKPKAERYENWLKEQDNKTAILLNAMTEEVRAQLAIVDIAQEDKLEIIKAFEGVIKNADSSADLALILSSNQFKSLSSGNEQVYIVAQNAVKAGMRNFSASQERSQTLCANYANWRSGNILGMRSVSLGYPSEGIEKYCQPILNAKSRDAQKTREMPSVLD